MMAEDDFADLRARHFMELTHGATSDLARSSPPRLGVLPDRPLMSSMAARAIQKGDTIDRAIAWAEQELEGLSR
jgi:hypothetical protein